MILKNIDFSEYSLMTKRNVFHLQQYFSLNERRLWNEYLNKIEFSPLEHESIIARYEADLDKKFELSQPFLELASEVAERSGLFNLSPEFYAFRYENGHKVPWHRDSNRHKVTLLGYFGAFSGGQYEYQAPGNRIIQLAPKCGDVILAVNETCTGREINPLHRVCPIVTGMRFAIVVSMVSTFEITEPFGS